MSYVYDWMGNVVSVTDGTGTHEFTYDYTTSGHPGLVSASVPYIVDHSVNYTYDGVERRTGMQLKNDGVNVLAHSYAYDVRNRLATVGNGVHTTHYTRQPGTGLLTQTQIKDASNNVIMSAARTYDQYYRLTSVSSTPTGNAASARTYTYDYNLKDQRAKCTMADGSYWEYAYDEQGQVIAGVKKDASGKAIPGQSFGF